MTWIALATFYAAAIAVVASLVIVSLSLTAQVDARPADSAAQLSQIQANATIAVSIAVLLISVMSWRRRARRRAAEH